MTLKTIFWLSIVFIVLNILDLLSTWTALNAGLQEGNPLIKNLVDNHFMLFSILKLSVVGVIIYVYNQFFIENMKIKSVGLMCLNLFYFGIVFNNFYMVWRFS